MYIIKGWCSFLPNCLTGAGLLLLAQLYVAVHCSLTVQDCTAALPAPAHHLVPSMDSVNIQPSCALCSK